jgi:hypothetical protein
MSVNNYKYKPHNISEERFNFTPPSKPVDDDNRNNDQIIKGKVTPLQAYGAQRVLGG